MGVVPKLALGAIVTLFAIVSGLAFAQETGEFRDSGSVTPDIVPSDDGVGPVGETGAEYKFDEGFYDEISQLIDTTPQDGDPGVFEDTRYYNVILVVSRDDGDEREPDEDSISITDHSDGTATITLDPEEIPPGTYAFSVTVSDPENFERGSYVIETQ